MIRIYHNISFLLHKDGILNNIAIRIVLKVLAWRHAEQIPLMKRNLKNQIRDQTALARDMQP